MVSRQQAQERPDACRISVRAKSVTGSTVGITFFIGLHTYVA